MFIKNISTDYNGICLFEPTLLQGFYGAIAAGENLLKQFLSTEDGDLVLNRGIIIPILAIDDAGYDIVVRLDNEVDDHPLRLAETICVNGVFPLCVRERLVIADLAVLVEWEQEVGWIDVPVPPGNYGVMITGKRIEDSEGRITIAGFEIVLNPMPQLPPCTADTSKNMKLFFKDPQ